VTKKKAVLNGDATIEEALPGLSVQGFLDLHRESIGDQPLGITDLAKQFAISPRAIRFYEDKGLLSPQRINGGRAYTRRDQVRLSLILRGKAIGMSLSEIEHIMELYGQQGEGKARQLEYLIDRINATAAELSARKQHIEATLSELDMIRAEMERDLKQKQRTA
jgi:DNA-binding transcriptional MerR regulator